MRKIEILIDRDRLEDLTEHASAEFEECLAYISKKYAPGPAAPSGDQERAAPAPLVAPLTPAVAP